MFSKFLLFFWTVRYLRFGQLFYRIFYRFKPVKISRIDELEIRYINLKWLAPNYSHPATKDGRSISFNGIYREIDTNWNSAHLPKLWLYNLHYQNDLNVKLNYKRTQLNKQLIDSWIVSNPPKFGVGWEPYCISLRVINWVKWFGNLSNHEISTNWLSSLHLQVQVLEQTIEYQVMANHLFANAKAMIFAGVYFGGTDGERWLQKGCKILDAQLHEQFLDDGGHFELSPMYQALLLWDLADLIHLSQISKQPKLAVREEELKRRLSLGLLWFGFLVHPDTKISFFNDSTFNVAPELADLTEYAKFLNLKAPLENTSVGLSSKLLSNSGYGIIKWSDQHKLIADVAKIGPNYQPGHGHADTLSFELSLFGQRLLVNSGISTYEVGKDRHWQRSTAAHNTVEVNEKNSSEVWSSFRVARRAMPYNVQMVESSSQIKLSASHTGYERFKKSVTHQRSWLAQYSSLVIVDNLFGNFFSAKSYWHLHPSVKLSKISSNQIIATLSEGQQVFLSFKGANIRLLDGFWYPSFGVQKENSCIVLIFNDDKVETSISWLKELKPSS